MRFIKLPFFFGLTTGCVKCRFLCRTFLTLRRRTNTHAVCVNYILYWKKKIVNTSSCLLQWVHVHCATTSNCFINAAFYLPVCTDPKKSGNWQCHVNKWSVSVAKSTWMPLCFMKIKHTLSHKYMFLTWHARFPRMMEPPENSTL